jgi:ABC-type transport system involved in cytochrome c biogenesis permease subunit
MKVESFIYTTAFLYTVSTLHYLLFLILRKDKLATVGLYAARFGFLTNLVSVVLTIISGGATVLFTLRGAFLALSVSIVSVFLYFSTKHKLSLSGAFLMPWATALLVASAFTSGIPKDVFPVGITGVVHIFTAFLGYSAFIFSAILSVIYLIFDRHLKKKKFSVFFRKLPSLSLVESVIYHSITVGFTFITVSMFTGAIWSEKIFGSFWSWHPKQVATLITWFIYAGIIHLYLYGSWRGKKLCYMSIVGFLVILMDFIGVNFFSARDIHSFKG